MALPIKEIETRLVEAGHSDEEARLAGRLYKMFVAFAGQHPGRMIAPPYLADMAWHEHLAMAGYTQDTVAACGRALVHDADEFDSEPFWEAWAFSRELFSEEGVNLPRRGEDSAGSSLRPHTCVVLAA